MAHQIELEDGDKQPCFCPAEASHEDPGAGWNMFDEEGF